MAVLLLGALQAAPALSRTVRAVTRKPAARPASAALPWNATVPVWWDVARASSGHGLLMLHVGGAILRCPFSSVDEAEREGPRLSARLMLIAATRASLGDVLPGRCDDGPALLWRNRVVMVATRLQARDLGLDSPDAVTAGWAAAIRAAAASTALPSSVPKVAKVAVGEQRLIPLPDAWRGTAVDNPSSDTVSVQVKGAFLAIGGRGTGVSVLRLHKDEREEDLEVHVLQKAGVVPPAARAEIAGTSPSADFIADGVRFSVEQASRPVNGAGISTYVQTAVAQAGGNARVTAWLEGPDLWPVVQSVLVSVQATDARFEDATRLAASNNPERIERDGVLLDTPVGNGNTVFYFHHQNAPGDAARWLEVRLENRTDTPTDLLVMESGAGPSRDELYAGHIASWRYLRWMVRGNGWRLHLAPHEVCVLDDRILGAQDVACGIGQVEVLQGAAPNLVVEATAASSEPAYVDGETAPLPHPTAAIIRGRGLFARPVLDIAASYSVGGPYAFVPIGGPPYENPLGDGTPNTGNYGVEYRIHMHLLNPTTEERKVYVVFAVGGGVARGSLAVDGQLMETPVMHTEGTAREWQLAEYTLQSGEEKTVELLAVPEPGSNYPIRIIAKPLPANR